MKKNKFKFIGVLLFLLIILPMNVSASDYIVKSADFNISFDYEWYVFTIDNLEGNVELDDLELDYDTMHEFMTENDVVLDAFYDEMEIFIRAISSEDNSVNNLSNYTNGEVKDLALELAIIMDSDIYEVYNNDYKFAYLDYYDSEYKVYVIEYYTIINNKNYAVTVQKASKFTDEEKATIKEIVDSIEFDIDEKYINEDLADVDFSPLVRRVVIGAIVFGVVAIGSFITNKIKKNKEKK